MKFVTPATASEPYAAEAPPVTTPTFETSPCGSRLKSVLPAMLLGTTRRPSSSTRLRFVPRLRRLRKLPGPRVLRPPIDCGVVVLVIDGNSASAWESD